MSEGVVGRDAPGAPLFSGALMDSLRFTVKTVKARIAYINFLFEAYDGVAAITTADPEEGLLNFLVSPDFEADFRRISEAIGREIEFRIV